MLTGRPRRPVILLAEWERVLGEPRKGGDQVSGTESAGLTAALRGLSPDVLLPEEYGRRRAMWALEISRRLAEVVGREDREWDAVRSVADWERFRDRRIAALRDSLALPEESAAPQTCRVTGEDAGDGWRLKKVVYETQPGVVVSALLYLPARPAGPMPAIQVCHAHHRPKEQVELQDMGVNWARAGCAVLIPDLVGHGERREDPFGGRQGYYSRYHSAMQLHLVGRSLTGWMVWDLLRGHDVLLGLPGIDPGRLVIVGAVAGGGDLAAIAAALDPRVRCSVPFNFGQGSAWPRDLGWEPPAGVNLAGYGYWETTRNLWRSARDGFLPWVIVAAAAPRHLVYAHEFAWDAEADPAWDRLRKVYDLYGHPERLGWCKGEGRCAPGSGNTHCTNVGPIHRAGVYPWLDKWFGMVPPTPEVQDRREPERLVCRDAEAAGRAVPLRRIAASLAGELLRPLRAELECLPGDERRARLRALWSEVLGDTAPVGPGRAVARAKSPVLGHGAEGILLETGPGIDVPLLLLRPRAAAARPPVVVGVAQHGKAIFLERQAAEIARLLEAGLAVCLPDLRGTGETRPDEMHGLESAYISHSEDERMLGRSVLGNQLHDLRTVLAHLRSRPDIDGARLGLWGDSFAPSEMAGVPPEEHDSRKVDNPTRPNLPHGPAVAEPSGALLVMLAGLFEAGVTAVLARRGLAAFAAVFEPCFLGIPSDAVVPGMLRAGDIPDLAVALAPRPLRIEAPVDGRNCPIGADELVRRFEPAAEAWRSAPESLVLSAGLGDDPSGWLAAVLCGGPAGPVSLAVRR
ncbi:MAG TPA: acetylxylan esterase [Planctomycetota bacterium]|nr:acetylxylan esterase [Planctomycetota bacterium]